MRSSFSASCPIVRWLRTFDEPEHAVRQQRIALQIAPFRARPKFKRWSVKDVWLLGTMPDEELAARLKRTVGSVKGARFSYKIPIFHPQKRKWTRAEDDHGGNRPGR